VKTLTKLYKIILLGGESLFKLDVLCVSAEKQIICDLSKEGKIVEAVVILLFVHFVFNYDYSIQRNLMLFYQTVMLPSINVKLP